MKKGRRNFPSKFKAKVALEALEGGYTLAELSTWHEVHSAMISNWKRHLLEHGDELFDAAQGRKAKQEEDLTARVYQQIGALKAEFSWLKKAGNVDFEQ